MANIYLHNPRCSKSRQGIEVLENAGIKFKIKEYLKDSLSKNEVELLYSLLTKNYSPKDFTRHKEKLFKEENLSLDKLNKKNWVSMILKNPLLIERPILFDAKKAIIGRPPEDLKKYK